MSPKSTKPSPEFAGGLADLPTEIITEILVRLPLKSIGMCRCVCKSLAALTSSPSFINTHLDLQYSNNNNHHHLLCTLSCWRPHRHHAIYLLRRGGGGAAAAPHLLNFPPLVRFYSDPCLIVESCSHRGLVCVWTNNSTLPIYLWNPSIGEWRTLPAIPLQSEIERYVWVGLGSLRLGDGSEDYKVGRLLRLKDKDKDKDKDKELGIKFKAEVYSLRRDDWKEVGMSSRLSLLYFCGVDAAVTNQSINCVGLLKDRLGMVVVVFDVAAEMFRCIDFSPEILPRIRGWDVYPGFLLMPVIGVWKGRVLGVLVNTEEGEWEVWVVRGETLSAKVFVFRPKERATPRGFIGDGELFFSQFRSERLKMIGMKLGDDDDDDEMRVKVVDDEFVRPIEVRDGRNFDHYCTNHVESLVSVLNYRPN